MSDRPLDEEAIVRLAQQIDNPEARAAYLDLACQGDEALRNRVGVILDVRHNEESFANSNLDITASAQTPVTEGAGTLVGRYKLLQKIGEGGFGVVYMAEQKEPVKRRVALKIVKLGMDTKQVVARFESERQALALMDHPHIAKVLDAGATDTGRPFFVMELVKGVRITKYCDDHKLTTKERLNLFIPICHAVQHAHMKGIIHRDIKPSNVLVTMHDGQPVPKVIDFGIAKATQQELTEKTLFTAYGQFIGTPAYMSPEQAEMSGLDIDTRTDIYSLGVLLYELLVGHTPIDARELMSGGYDQIRRLIKEELPSKPSTKVSSLVGEALTTIANQRNVTANQLSSELKGDLDWIVLKALEKDRTRRYETAGGFAEDILRHLNHQPVLAVAPSAAYRLRTFVRRYRAALAVAATIAGLLIAGMVIFALLAAQAIQAQKKEHEQRIVAEEKTREANERGAELKTALESVASLRTKAERDAYIAKMWSAQADFQLGNFEQLQATLDSTKDAPGRGFEWYYWQNQLHQELRSLDLGRALDGVNISANPTELVLHDRTRSYIVDRISGAIRSVHARGSVSADGLWLASDTELTNLETGRTRRLNLPSLRSGFRHFSGDGTRCAEFDRDAKMIRVWDSLAVKQIAEIKTIGDWRRVLISPDGEFVATSNGNETGTISVFPVDTGKEPKSIRTEGDNLLGFSPDSRHLVTQNYFRLEIKLLDVSDLTTVNTYPVPFSQASRVAFSSDGKKLAVATLGGIVQTWDVEESRLLATYPSRSQPSFSRDGNRLFTCSGGVLREWSTEPRGWLRFDWSSTTLGYRAPFEYLTYSRDAERLLAQCGANIGVPLRNVYLMETANGKELQSFRGVRAAALFPNGQRIAVSENDREDGLLGISILDDQKEELDFIETEAPVNNLLFSGDGGHLFFRETSNAYGVIDSTTREVRFRNSNPVRALEYAAFSDQGDKLALLFRDTGEIVLCDASSGVESGRIEWDSTSEQIRRPKFSPDGQRLVAAWSRYAPGTTSIESYGAAVYDTESGQRQQTIEGHSMAVPSVRFSPDGTRIITASLDGSVRVWDASTGIEVLTLREESNGGFQQIWGMSVAPTGRQIAMGGKGGAMLKTAASEEQVDDWITHGARKAVLDKAWWRRHGGVQDWLVLAPIPVKSEEAVLDALQKGQIGSEYDLSPQVGETLSVGGKEYTWQSIQTEDWMLDFEKVLGQQYDKSVGLAVSYIHCDTPKKGVKLLIGYDQLAKVYLNRQVVYASDQETRSPIPRAQEIIVDLDSGRNTLVFKAVQRNGDWGVAAQFVDEAYRPIPDLRSSLE